MNTKPTNVKSPYFRNTLQADDFEDKVHMLRDKPHAIAIGFDADPNTSDCTFEIACRKTETEGEMLSSLVYVITKIAEGRGLRTKVVFAPIVQPQQVQVFHAPVIGQALSETEVLLKDEAIINLAEKLVETLNPTVEEIGKLQSIMGLFKRKPPTEPTNV